MLTRSSGRCPESRERRALVISSIGRGSNVTQDRESPGSPEQQCCFRREVGSNDFVERKIAWFLWGIPKGMLVVGVFWSQARLWLWVPALLVGGTACLVNAARCGRLHCYFTGPLYLLAALATVLSSLRIVPLRWGWILAAVVTGIVFAYTLEGIRGKYIGRVQGG